MGIDITGGMIVGAKGDSIDIPESINDNIEEYAEDNDMESRSPHYDADEEDKFFGFNIPDILVSDINDAWVESIKEKARKFKELTGADAKLIGMQNVW